MKINIVIIKIFLNLIVEYCFEDMLFKILNLLNGCKYKVVILKFCIYIYLFFLKYIIMIYFLKLKGKKDY